MTNTSKKIFIIAGEESGDMRAAGLVRAIKERAPDTRFIGIAGDRSREAGVETFLDIEALAVIGFVEVIRHYPRLKKIFNQTLAKIQEEKPDILLLVDYPGFNLRMAKAVKPLGIRVVYYVSPQVWAWKSSRVHLIKKVVDRMMVMFPFEKDFYKKYDYDADFVGHPLLDEVHADKNPDEFKTTLGLNPKRPILALLPGSRKKELACHLPAMIQAAAILQKDHPSLQFLLLRAKSLDDQLFEHLLKNAPVPIVSTRDCYNGINASTAALVASGTATLETGILTKPMVVVYRTSWLSYLIFKMVIRIKYISLVNIVAGKKIVEELVQGNFTADKTAKAMHHLLKDPTKMQSMRRELAGLRSRLGDPGASHRAAKIVIEELNK